MTRKFCLRVILGFSGLLLLTHPAAAAVTCDDNALSDLQKGINTAWYHNEWECQSELQSATNNPGPATTARAGKACQAAAAARSNLAASYLQLIAACSGASEQLKARLNEIGQSLRQVPPSISSAVAFANPKSQLLTLSLDRMPATRVKVNLDETQTGRHLETEWDPSLSNPLVKLLTLPRGRWQSSLWVEPLVSSTMSRLTIPVGISIPASAVTFFDAAGSPVRITLNLSALPKLRDVHKALPLGSLSESGVRGIDSTVPAAAQEVLRIFAEIAYERARSKSFELLSQLLTRFICDDLKIPGDLAPALGLPAQELLVLPATCRVVKNLRVQELGSSAQALLRSLMTDVSQIATDILLAQLNQAASKLPAAAPAVAATPGSLPSVAAQPPVMRGADAQALSDFAQLMARAMGPIFNRTLTVLVDAAAGRRPLTVRDAGLVLEQLRQVNWLQGLGPTATLPRPQSQYAVVGCALQLGFAVLTECQKKGGCDPREIAERVARPADFYDLDADQGNQVAVSCAAYLTPEGEGDLKLRNYFPDLEQFIARGQEILFPDKGTASLAVARNAIDLSFDIAERLRCTLPIAEKMHSADACGDPAHLGEVLKNLRAITMGIMDRDVVPTMLGITELLKRALDRQRDSGAWKDPHGRLNFALAKANQVLTALGSYAASYTSPGDASTANAQHAARKKAVESLIDATTRRNNRDGQWVVSIGASVGFYGGVQWIRSKPDCYSDAKPCLMVPQLSLPMGVALQYLPNRQDPADKLNPARARSVSVGWHLQLSPIDLGQFIALDGNAKLTDNVRWTDFVLAGLQTGLIVGTPDVNFLLAADFRWLPTVFPAADGQSAGAFRFGLTLAYYLPFFDFN